MTTQSSAFDRIVEIVTLVGGWKINNFICSHSFFEKLKAVSNSSFVKEIDTSILRILIGERNLKITAVGKYFLIKIKIVINEIDYNFDIISIPDSSEFFENNSDLQALDLLHKPPLPPTIEPLY